MTTGIGTSGLSMMVDRSKKYELQSGEVVDVLHTNVSKGKEQITVSVNRHKPPEDLGDGWCVKAICTPDKHGDLIIKVSVKKTYEVRHLWAIYTGLQRLGVPENQARAAVVYLWKDCDDLNGG